MNLEKEIKESGRASILAKIAPPTQARSSAAGLRMLVLRNDQEQLMSLGPGSIARLKIDDARQSRDLLVDYARAGRLVAPPKDAAELYLEPGQSPPKPKKEAASKQQGQSSEQAKSVDPRDLPAGSAQDSNRQGPPGWPRG